LIVTNFRCYSRAQFCALLVATLVSALTPLPKALGQAPQMNSVSDLTQTPIPGAGHDYQKLLGETLNFSNGSLTFKISFPVPKALGVTVPYAWSYNSAGVNLMEAQDSNTPVWNFFDVNGVGPNDGWNALGIPSATAQVWSISPGNPIIVPLFPSVAPTGTELIPCNFQSGMTFTDLAGVTHNLNVGASTPSYPITPGYTDTCQSEGTSGPSGDGQVVATLNPTTASSALNGSNPSSGSFVVTDKDGTTYIFPGGYTTQDPGNAIPVVSIVDRNGNPVNFTALGSGPGVFIDAAGRQGPILSGANLPSGGSGTSTTTTITTLNSNTGPSPNSLVYTSIWNAVPDTVNYNVAYQVWPGLANSCNDFPTNVAGTRSSLSSLALPNGEKFIFYYGNNNPTDSTVLNPYGLLNEIIYPDGGWIKYTWQLSSGFNQMITMDGFTLNAANNANVPTALPYCLYQYQTPVLASRQLSFDGTTIAQIQNFTFSTTWAYASGGTVNNWSSKSATVTTTDNVLGKTSSTAYTYLPYYPPSQPSSSGNTASAIPLESTIQYSDWGQTTPTKTVTKTWLDQFNMTSQTTVINPTNQVSQTIYRYGSPTCTAGQLNSETESLIYLQAEDEWNFGLLTPSTAQQPTAPGVAVTTPSVNPTRKTLYSYNCFGVLNGGALSTYGNGTPEFPGLSLPPKVSTVLVENGSGTVQAATQYGYDANTLSNPTSGSLTVRGNVTSITRCTTPSATCTVGPTTTYTYDGTGQPASMTDGCGNASCGDMSGVNHTTKFSFVDNTSPNGVANPAGYSSNAYLTSITYPAVGSITLTKKFSYNYVTGYLAGSVDENSQQTTYSYGGKPSQCSTQDYMERLTQVNYPDGGITQNCYVDTEYSPTLTAWKQLTTTPALWETNLATMDGMEHVVSSKLTSDPNTTDTVTSQYDGEGHAYKVTNPQRSSSSTTDGVSYHYYDAFGRQIETVEQDGNLLQSCYDGRGSSPAVQNCNSTQFGSASSGTWVDSTDEAGNHWQRVSDAFGDLTKVMEPNGATQTPTMETDYVYNLLNDLTSATQLGISGSSAGTRVRSFVYDNLSRLTSATNPETGKISYVYDNNNNVSSKTDGRNITVTYTYDDINRLFTKTYSSGDPSVCMQYDLSPATGGGDPYPLGRLTHEWTIPAGSCPTGSNVNSTIPTTAYNSTPDLAHDKMGRVITKLQCPIGGGCATNYSFNYVYDLAGGVAQFNNGIPAALSSATSPALTWGITLNGADQIASLNVLSQPYTNSTTYPDVLLQVPTGSTQGAWGYDPMGHLVLEEASQTSTGATAGLEILSSYDPRGRILSEVAGGNQTAAVPTGSVGIIAVNGQEQSAQMTATASLQVTGAGEGPVTWYPCGNSSCPAQQYDTGTITATISGHSVSVPWGGPITSANVASSLVAQINGISSTTGVTADVSNSTVWLYANSETTRGSSISLSASAVDTTPDSLFSSPAFSVTPSGSTFYGGDATVYDTGNITVSLTNVTSSDGFGTTIVTSAAVPWTSASTSTSLASALSSAINTAAGSYVTAAIDETGMSVNLKSVASGSSSDNYGIEVNITDTTSTSNSGYNPASLPTLGFEFDASSTAGASNGLAASNFGTIYSYRIPAGGYSPTSNIVAHSDSVMGDWAFQYDSLNRLVAGAPAENAPTAYLHNVGCWAYDPFGNRTQESFISASDCSSVAGTQSVSYNSSNQISFVTSLAPTGLTYDSGGNVIWDGTYNYAYDGEGRLCAVQLPSIQGGAQYQYIYDAEGARVAKATFTGAFPAKNTVCAAPGAAAGYALKDEYLVDTGGNQVTELNTTSGTMAWAHSNVWAGSHLEATYDLINNSTIHNTAELHFHLADPLGTRRLQTNTTGVWEEVCQSLPFGDQLSCSPNPNVNTSDDATEHHFTGKERDSESGNDYFGARYLASTMGRFMTPDWSAKVEPVPYSKLDDPQSLNLYAYMMNNPLGGVDADGHMGSAAEATAQATEDWVNGYTPVRFDPPKAQQQNTITARVKGRSVTYTYPDGSKVVLTGGPKAGHPFRDNNPGDLKSGHGSIGRDGKFAIYPTLDAGVNALGATLTGKYAGSTIGDTMKAFAPASDGNDPVKYANTLATAVGVPVTTKISALTPAQLMTFQFNIAVAEGYNAAGNTASYIAPPQ
jgi:RHS repeat-associated protein